MRGEKVLRRSSASQVHMCQNLGNTQPVASNDTNDGWAKNRHIYALIENE